jgi:hypothetical protein
MGGAAAAGSYSQPVLKLKDIENSRSSRQPVFRSVLTADRPQAGGKYGVTIHRVITE